MTQKEFPNLLGKYKPLRYDFYLPEELLQRQDYDNKKRDYAVKNHITLLEIWYWDFDNIESILNEKLSDEMRVA